MYALILCKVFLLRVKVRRGECFKEGFHFGRSDGNIRSYIIHVRERWRVPTHIMDVKNYIAMPNRKYILACIFLRLYHADWNLGGRFRM